jgi:nucleotide-binding universal stress UspA family protein
MINKIICPTDFSVEAINATEYAAKLAQALNAELLFVNVYQIPLVSKVALAEGIDSDVKENGELASERLSKVCREINKKFGIVANYEVDITTKSLTEMLAASGNEDSLIVMGTGGIQYVRDFFFGTNTYRVIKKAKCPVLLVPENCTYGTYKNVVYAEAYEEKARLALKPFYEFIKPFNTQITFLHVSEHDTEISKDVFKAEREEIETFFKDKIDNIHFERQFSYTIEEDIENYVSKNSADILVMAVRHRNVFEAVFKKRAIISDLTAVPKFPILIFHS